MARSRRITSSIVVCSLSLWSCGPAQTPANPAQPAQPAAGPTPVASATPMPSGEPALPPKAGPVDSAKRHFPEKFSSELPVDIDEGRVRALDKPVNLGQDSAAVTKALEAAQREFDIFSWESFLALNWPVDAEGKPLAKLTAPSEFRVWSTWRTGESIFKPDGSKPDAWTGQPAKELLLFRAKGAWRAHGSPWHAAAASENFQAFTGPLVDQNGNWVRYEVLINSEEFSYLVKNELYNLEGQAAFAARESGNEVAFPVNDGAHHGATEIKLSWKVLGPGDDPKRFFVAKVKISPSEFLKPGQKQSEAPNTVEAGLVGMHIAVHTHSSPEWIWATFEQVDNTRVKDESGNAVHANFFNPAKPSGPNDVNVLAPKNAILDPATGAPAPPGGKTPTTWAESLTKVPTQVKRIDVPTRAGLNPFDETLAKDAAELNHEVQGKLRELGSAFQYYELIGTQWPVHPNAPAFAGGEGSAPESITHKVPGDVVPVFLVNTSMETFFMHGSQFAGGLEQDDRLAGTAPTIDHTEVVGTESCVGCHYSSGICLGFKKTLDGAWDLDPVTGQKKPVFGENSHFGKTGNANFSWLLQIEARSKEAPQPTPVSAARFINVPAESPAPVKSKK